MSHKGILQIDEFRLVARPYLQGITTAILFLGVLGGWAGAEWPIVITVFIVATATVIWIGRQSRLHGVDPKHVYTSTVINLSAASIVVLMTGGAHSLFWLLFFIGAVTSAMTYRGQLGITLERINAGVATLVLFGPELVKLHLDGHTLSLAGVEVITILGSSVLVRKITTLMLENRDKLGESEERLRALFDTARDVIITFDTNGKVTSLSPSFERLTGWTRDEWLGHTFKGLIAEEDLPKSSALFRRVLRGEMLSHTIRVHARTQAKDDVVVELNMSPQIEDGQVIGVFGIARDMTMEQREEDALKESEDQYRRLVEHSPYGVAIHVQGNVIYMNATALNLIGAENIDDVLNKPVLDFVHPDSRKNVMLRLKEMNEGHDVPSLEEKFICLNGRVIDVEVTAFPFKYRGESAIQVVFQDVTVRKQAEAEKQRTNQELILLDKIRTALAQELELSSLFRTVVESIVNTFGYTLVSLYIKEGDTLVLQHQVGSDNIYETISIDQGVSGRVIRTKKPVYLEDIHTDPNFLGAVEGITSEICIPLFNEGNIAGVLNVESTQGIKLTEDDLRLMTTLGEHINIAIGRATIYNDLQKNINILSALQNSIPPLMGQLELSEALQAILVQASQLMNTQHGYIYLVEPEKKAIKVVLGTGIYSQYIGTKMKAGEGLAGKVWETGEHLNVQDYITWQGHSSQYTDTEFHAVAGVPLTFEGTVVGILGLGYIDPDLKFSDSDIELLNQFAQLASIAYRNAHLFTQAQQELSDRKMTEEALRDSEERYRAIFQTSGVSIWEEDYSSIEAVLNDLKTQGVTDFRGYFNQHPEFIQQAKRMLKVVDVNNLTLKLCGANDKSELLSSLDTVLGPESNESFSDELIALVEGTSYVEGEVTAHDLQGNYLYLWKTVVFPQKTSRYKNALVCLTDITQRKQAENTLLRRESDLARSQAMARLGNYSWNIETGDIEWSAALKSIWDIGGAEPSFEFSVSHIHPDDRDYVEEAGRRAREENALFDIEYRIIRDDGSIVYVQDRAEVLRDENGTPVEMFGTVLDITNRKKAEEMVRQSEERLHLILESALDAVITMDTQGVVVEWNHQAEALFGWAQADAIGQHMAELIIPEELHAVHQLGLKRFLETGEGPLIGKRIEVDGLHKSGKVFPLELTITPVTTSSGLTFTGFIRDITARKRAEEVLRESEQRFRSLVESGEDEIVVFNTGMKSTYISPSVIRNSGYTMKQMMVQPTLSTVHHEDQAIARKIYKQVIRFPNQDHRFQLRLIHKDGSPRWIEGIANNLLSNPSIEGIVLNYRDITSRKQAEEELQASEERFRSTLDNMLAGCQVIGFDWHYLYVNDEVARQGHTSKERLLGHTMMEVYPGIEITEMFHALQTCMKERTYHRMENEFIYSDGSTRWFDLSIQPVPEGIFIVSLDITERKKAESLQMAINNIAQAVLTTNSLEELFPQIHAALTDILPVENFYIALYDSDQDMISYPYFIDQHDISPLPQKPGRGLTEYVLRTKNPLLVTQDIFNDLIESGEVHIMGANSHEWLGVPLFLKEDVLGVMAIQTYEAGIHFSQRDVDILTYVSTQAGNAIERKRTEDETRAAEIRYRTLVEQLPAIIYTAGPDQFIGETYVSPQIEQFGYTQEEWLADPERWLKQVHIEDRERVLSEIDDAKEGRKPFQSEYRLLKRDGHARWIRDEVIPVKDDNGNPILLQGIMMDITERKEAEERGKRQLDKLKALRTIDTTIVASTDLHLSLQTILKHTISQLQVDAADVMLLNPITHRLTYHEGVGFLTRGIEQSSIKVGDGFSGRAVQTRKTTEAKDIRTEKGFLRKELIKGEAFVSYVGMPLIAKGQIKGILEIFNRKQLQPDNEWMDFLESLAGQTALAIDNASLFEGLRRSNFELGRAYESTLEGWSAALDLRDKETEGHTQRVTALTLQLAEAMGIGRNELVHMRRGALLHDIGKMGVPDRILLKPDKLTDEEMEIMRQHPVYAWELLSPIEYLRSALDIPYCHHEKWDGTGYPRGLEGEFIPLAARIFAITDVYDALTSDRPYRPAWTKKKTLEHIKSLSDSHFDPKVVNAFLGLPEMVKAR